jgi:hypothetical protein
VSAHGRRVKSIEFSLDSESFECQVEDWTFDPGVPDGERVYTQCPDGVVIDDGDAEPTLMVKFLADWKETGVSWFLYERAGETVAFSLSHHPEVTAENVVVTGTLKIKPAPIQGTRQLERSEVTFQVLTWENARGGA